MPEDKDDRELERKIEALQYPNGPEDKLIEKYGFTWDVLKDFKNRKDWPLASKLAACLIEIGELTEGVVERETFWHHMYEKLEPLALAVSERIKVDDNQHFDVHGDHFGLHILELQEFLRRFDTIRKPEDEEPKH